MELKVGGSAGFEAKVERWKTESLNRLLQLLEKPSRFQALLLVSCKAKRVRGGNSWEQPFLQVELWYRDDWQALSQVSVRKAVKKKSLVKDVLDSLKWYQNPGAPKVALVSNFLKKVGKPNGNCGKYVQVWNKALEEEGFEVLFERLRFHSGSKPWVGTRQLFKKAYEWL